MRLPDTEAWLLFASVADLGGFRAAATAHGLSVPTVSKAIARLEAHLGMALFHRTSRRITLTLAGERLVESARAIATAAQSAEEAAISNAGLPAGPVRITASMSLGLACLGEPLAQFLAAYPAVTLDLILSDAQCDLVADAIDIALRISEGEDSSLLTRVIAPVPTLFVASPAYIARFGEPQHPDDLSRHRMLGYGHARRDAPIRLNGPDGARATIEPNGPLFANNGEVMVPMLTSGEAMAVLPRFLIADHLNAGRLLPVMTQWALPPLTLGLVTPPSRLRPQRVRLLADYLVETLRQSPLLRH